MMTEGGLFMNTAEFISILSSKKDDSKWIKSEIEDARREWMDSMEYFRNASQPELIDYAIYSMEATRLKYFYFIKLARETGLRIEYSIAKPKRKLHWRWPLLFQSE